MIRGEDPGPLDVRIEPLRVVTRLSTDILVVEDKNVTTALSFSACGLARVCPLTRWRPMPRGNRRALTPKTGSEIVRGLSIPREHRRIIPGDCHMDELEKAATIAASTEVRAAALPRFDRQIATWAIQLRKSTREKKLLVSKHFRKTMRL